MPIDSCSTIASKGEPFDPSNIASISVFKSETGIEVLARLRMKVRSLLIIKSRRPVL